MTLALFVCQTAGMSGKVLNSVFDAESREVAVQVEGMPAAWIDIDTLISRFHGAGSPSKESIRGAIENWLVDRRKCEKARKSEEDIAVMAVSALRGTVLRG